ncbi:MAG: hypothetical protein GYB31_13640 [Bacteroidetes bacterium]|nr:hypothetical protein [Bacteroidota bacterium]
MKLSKLKQLISDHNNILPSPTKNSFSLSEKYSKEINLLLSQKKQKATRDLKRYRIKVLDIVSRILFGNSLNNSQIEIDKKILKYTKKNSIIIPTASFEAARRMHNLSIHHLERKKENQENFALLEKAEKFENSLTNLTLTSHLFPPVLDITNPLNQILTPKYYFQDTPIESYSEQIIQQFRPEIILFRARKLLYSGEIAPAIEFLNQEVNNPKKSWSKKDAYLFTIFLSLGRITNFGYKINQSTSKTLKSILNSDLPIKYKSVINFRYSILNYENIQVKARTKKDNELLQTLKNISNSNYTSTHSTNSLKNHFLSNEPYSKNLELFLYVMKGQKTKFIQNLPKFIPQKIHRKNKNYRDLIFSQLLFNVFIQCTSIPQINNQAKKSIVKLKNAPILQRIIAAENEIIPYERLISMVLEKARSFIK